MAVCIIMEFAGMNAERYEALMNQLRLRGVNPAFPNGVVSNVVGFTRRQRACSECLGLKAALRRFSSEPLDARAWGGRGLTAASSYDV